MAALVVNIVLILAVLVLLATWAIGGIRRRRQDRRQHAEDRTLILQAFLGVGAPASGTTTQPPTVETAPTGTLGPQHLDGASVAARLDLLEDCRPTRRGLFAGLVKGPRGIWDAGTRAGQNIGRHTTGAARSGGTAGMDCREDKPTGTIVPVGPSRVRRPYMCCPSGVAAVRRDLRTMSASSGAIHRWNDRRVSAGHVLRVMRQ